MKLLVTGSAGLVGSEAVSFFKEVGWEVVGIDNNMRAHLFGTQEQKTERSVDIRDENAINNIFATNKFDAIIHAAAQPSHDWAKQDPLTDFDINARGTLILLEATRKYCPDAVFVYVSSDKVYGENMWSPGINEGETRYENEYNQSGFREHLGLDFAGQRSLFGCSKTAADIYVQEYGNYFGMKTACFRPGCITGRNHQGAELHGFLAYLAKCFKEEKPYMIFGNGKQVRDQIHVHDLVTALYEFIKEPSEAAVFNMGGGPERSVSVLEAISLFEKETGKTISIGYGPERQGDRRWDVHDMKKFRSMYPSWDYKYSLADIIKELTI